MGNRKLTTAPQFNKDSKKLNIHIKSDIKSKVEKLLSNPFHPELNIKKLSGLKNKYRVVIIENHRLVYTFNKEEIILIAIKHRKDIYNSKI